MGALELGVFEVCEHRLVELPSRTGDLGRSRLSSPNPTGDALEDRHSRRRATRHSGVRTSVWGRDRRDSIGGLGGGFLVAVVESAEEGHGRAPRRRAVGGFLVMLRREDEVRETTNRVVDIVGLSDP